MQLKKYKIKNPNAVSGGRTAKKIGAYFESFIRHGFNKIGASIVSIPSGCKWITFNRAISVQTPFDFFACKNGVAIAFDAKTVDKNTFSKSEMKDHQVKALYDLERSKMLAGYLVWFRPDDKIVFYKSSLLFNLKPRCSLKPCDGVSLGSLIDSDLGGVFLIDPN